MRVTIRQKNIEITDALRVYIETKIIKSVEKLLGKAADGLPILDLEFTRNTQHHRKGKVYHAEANLLLGKTRLRAEVDDEDMRAACDLLEEELRREIITFKNKRRTLAKRGARRIKNQMRES